MGPQTDMKAPRQTSTPLDRHEGPQPVWGGCVYRGSGVLRGHRLQNGLVESELHGGAVKHLPLVRVARHQPVDLHQLLLPDAVTARLGLKRHVQGRQVCAWA